MHDGHQKLDEALLRYFGYSEFRPLQREIIEDVLSGKDTFVLMPTGGGKSLCYQLPSLMKAGLVVVVSPLIALMKDQVDSLHELGIPATFINSSLDPHEAAHRKDLVKRGAVKLLYCAPERLVMPEFMAFLGSLDIAYFAIDEAHCISEWGHDFRAEYRQLSMLRKRFRDVPIMALTATATARVAEDIVEQLSLSKNVSRYKASFNRPNLNYYVKPKGDTFNDLVRFVESHKGESGIIYCMSRASTEGIAERLSSRGFKALAYHAGMSSPQRSKNQEMFIRDQVDIICATIAFGMGIDKSNVRYVVHYDISKNIEGYYQETGRAGRDGLPSDCVLFYSHGDKIKISRLIHNDKLPQNVIQNNLANLDTVCKYAELLTCRKKMMLRYFGEEMQGDNCGACDNCIGTKEVKETIDLTIPAQKFLSTIVRTSQRYGANYITDILLGNDTDDRIMHNGHHKLPTFGIGADLKKKEWQHIARELESEGLLTRDEEFGSLVLTTKGNEALVNRTPIFLAAIPKTQRTKEERVEKSRTVEADLPEMNAELFTILRSLRMKIAFERNVAPYMIFQDNTLKQMAALLPQSNEEFLRLSGVGEKKAGDLGELFTSAIRAYIGNHESVKKVEIKIEERPRVVEAKDTSLVSAKLFNEGKSVAEIAQSRGISMNTVSEHLAEAIAIGRVASIDRLVPLEKIILIKDALDKTKSLFLKPVMEYLNDQDISYDQIKYVRSFEDAKRSLGNV